METGSVKELGKDLIDQSIDLISKGKTKEGIEKIQSLQAVMRGLDRSRNPPPLGVVMSIGYASWFFTEIAVA